MDTITEYDPIRDDAASFPAREGDMEPGETIVHAYERRWAVAVCSDTRHGRVVGLDPLVPFDHPRGAERIWRHESELRIEDADVTAHLRGAHVHPERSCPGCRHEWIECIGDCGTLVPAEQEACSPSCFRRGQYDG